MQTPANRNAPAHPPTSRLSQLKRRRKYRLRRLNYDGVQLAGGGDEGAASLHAETARLQGELREVTEKALRARADLDNLRRRHQKEKDDLRKFATEDLIRSIVPAMDHFALAAQSLETATDPASVAQGVTMIHREMLGILSAAGLQEINPLDQPFDPAFHEAASTESVPDKPNNVVVEVLRPGWALRERVLRPALVKVNKVEEAAS